MTSQIVGIRSLVTLYSVALAILTMASLAALLVASAVFQRSMDSVSSDTRSAAIVDKIRVSVLMYQRLSNFLVVTGQPEIAVSNSEVAAELSSLLFQVRESAGGQSTVLIDRLAVSLGDYIQERERLVGDGVGLEQIVRSTIPAFTESLAILTSLQELIDRHILRAQRRAIQARSLASIVGISATGLLVAGLVTVGFGVRKYLSRPILALHNSMAAFRDGEFEVRDEPTGTREFVELAEIFNEMADRLGEHRKAQLAFVAGVAHDLKNPLSTLKNGMYLLEHELSEARRSRLRETMDSQVDMLARMIDDLLDATRIEAGQFELRYTQFDARELLQDIVRIYASSAPDHQLVLDLPDQPVRLEADHLRIEQVVRNLLTNAIKYSSGGKIVLSVATAGDEAVIAVTDQGIGIPQEGLSAIFLPFRRLKQNVAPGVGLGLSVVRRIVTAHGGTIDVQSEVGAGSTFQIRLRQVQAPAGEDRGDDRELQAV